MTHYNIFAPLCNTSFGLVAKNFIIQGEADTCESKWGWRPYLNDVKSIGQKDLTDWPEDVKYLIRDDSEPLNGESYPVIVFWHMSPLNLEEYKGPKYLYTFFELDRITPQELAVCEVYDLIVVSSKWNASVLSQYPSIASKVRVVNCGYDETIFYPSQEEKPKNSPYIFFNAGKFEVRKGHKELIEQFNRVFTEDDNVELWLSTTNKFYPPELTKYWENLCRHSKLSNKIKLLPWFKNQSDIAKVMRAIDCGVFASRGEGWNLELSEVIASGKPCIATNVSAHTEFVNESNCFLIEPTGMIDAYDGFWFKNQGQWFDFNANDVGNIMRKCYTENIRSNSGNVDQFTWTNAYTQLKKVIHEG